MCSLASYSQSSSKSTFTLLNFGKSENCGERFLDSMCDHVAMTSPQTVPSFAFLCGDRSCNDFAVHISDHVISFVVATP